MSQTPRRKQTTRRVAAWFPSHRSAASALGERPEIISAAAASGCPAFSGGRAHRATLVRWLAKHRAQLDIPAGGSQQLRDAVLRETARRLRLANDQKEGRLVLRSDVVETHDRILVRARSEFERRLVHELPIELQGADVATMRGALRKASDEMMEALKQCGDEWKY